MEDPVVPLSPNPSRRELFAGARHVIKSREAVEPDKPDDGKPVSSIRIALARSHDDYPAIISAPIRREEQSDVSVAVN